jgi:glycosyltransferase involved in cell wall biosynthesis
MGFLQVNDIELILAGILSVMLLIQLLYYFSLYFRIHYRNAQVSRRGSQFTEDLPPISIIIYTDNQYEQLKRSLPLILAQDYPAGFEVVIINGSKTDETEDYLKLMQREHENIYHSFLPDSSRYFSRKKLAITLAMRACKHDWVLMTEPGCVPASDQWLRLMASNCTPRTEIILGYSGYTHAKGWRNRMISFDNLLLSMRYLGAALSGSPYMGIGKNLLYRKELFYKDKGFTWQHDLQRGDDDLFVNRLANGRNTRVETDSRAAMVSDTPTPKEWKDEKTGFAITAHRYKGTQHYLMGFETTTRLVFYLSLLAMKWEALFSGHYIFIGVAALAWLVRWGFQCMVFNITAKDLNMHRRFYLSLPLFDFIQPWQSLRWKLRSLNKHKHDFLWQ